MDNALAIVYFIMATVSLTVLLELLPMDKLVLLAQWDKFGVELELIASQFALEDKHGTQPQVLASVQVVSIGMDLLALLAQVELPGTLPPTHVNADQDLISMVLLA